MLCTVPPITPPIVNRILLSFSPDKAVGIDRISLRLLRIEAPEIAPSVARLINEAFKAFP